jgi:hypothetical protein
MRWALITVVLAGCCVPTSLPSDVPAFDGPVVPGLKLPVRPRKLILPGYSSTPPRPDPLITSSQCEDLADGGPVEGPDCVTDTIQCGQTVIGSTRGGVQRFDTRFYEAHFCTPATTDHNGGEERVYRLEVPAGEWRTFVWLDTPCADLDVFGMPWGEPECPTSGSTIPRCEGNEKRGTTPEEIELVSQSRQPTTWLLVVEGKGAEEGAFALQTLCRPGVQ